MSTPAPVLITVRRVFGRYAATCGMQIAQSKLSGPDAAKQVAAAKLRCEPDQVILAKHAPGVFRATVAQPVRQES
jgi:hypothetical protein